MNLEQRLRKLENSLLTEPMILYFADGSTRKLPGSGEDLLHLYSGILEGEDKNPHLRTQVDWIRTCNGAIQPGGGQMFDVLRLIVIGKTGEERWPTSPGDPNGSEW